MGLWDEHGQSHYPPTFAHLKPRGHRASARPEDRAWANHLQYLTDTTSAYNANWGVVTSEFSMPETMEAIWRGFLDFTSPAEPLRFLATDEDESESVESESVIELAFRWVLAQSWWIASELVRRHPGLLVHEMHPGDGMYDVLCVVDSRHDDMFNQTRIMLNRTGTIQVHYPDNSDQEDSVIASWAEVLASNSPHEHVKALEAAARLERPTETPASRPITLAYRLIAALLNVTVNDRHRWDVRNEFHDSSSDDDIELLGNLDAFPSLRDDLRSAPTLGLPHEPESHYWIVLQDAKPVAAISTEGRAYFHDRTIELLPAYERAKRSIPHLLTETFGDLL